MKKYLIALLGCLIATGAIAAALKHYQPGPRLIDGTQLNLMVDQVNNLTGNGTAGTAAVKGVGANYKLARGETALDGTNPTPVTTGLTTIVSCALTIKQTATPGLSTSVLTYDTSSGTLNMYGWMVTSSSVTTLIASTYTPTVGWVCVGT